MNTQPARGWAYPLLLLGLLALAASLRCAALSAEFWFDEIWSWELARAASSPWDVLARLHHDNNHKLNTLYLFFCPAGLPWACYRAHSLLTGLIAVLLAAGIAGRRGRADAVFAAALTGTSYWLVLSSAEARGYASAVCFALVALGALQSWLERGGRLALGLFQVAVILGFLSHLTFVHCYLALFLWSMHRFARQGGGMRHEMAQLLRCHGVPCAFFAVLYLVDVRHMELGGGPPTPAWEVLGRLLGLGLGGPAGGLWALPWVVLAIGGFALGLRLLRSEPGSAGVFFAVAIVGAPALLLAKGMPFLFERYFLIPFVFLLLLLSYVLGALWRRGPACRALAVALLLAVMAGNLYHISRFVAHGRGQFHEALAYVQQADESGMVQVTGDFDFRIGKFCAFYGSPDRPLLYRSAGELPAEGVGWLIVHRLDERHPPGAVEYDVCGNVYRLERAYPSAGIGCWGCFVYRNERSGKP